MEQDRNHFVLTRIRRGVVGLAAAGAMLVVVAAPAASAGATVTQGDFHAYSAAEGDELEIGGNAQMVRRANGTTKVSIHVAGLEPGATYGSHVHDGSCAAFGGHYAFEGPVGGGDATGEDEIWPGPITANGGGVANGKATVGATAGETAMSVVIHRATGERIACADLS